MCTMTPIEIISIFYVVKPSRPPRPKNRQGKLERKEDNAMVLYLKIQIKILMRKIYPASPLEFAC